MDTKIRHRPDKSLLKCHVGRPLKCFSGKADLQHPLFVFDISSVHPQIVEDPVPSPAITY